LHFARTSRDFFVFIILPGPLRARRFHMWKRRCEEDTMKIADLYQSVTANIIKDLAAGTAPRTKPWKAGNTGGILSTNAATKRSYKGISWPVSYLFHLPRPLLPCAAYVADD
jgi:hypothetical protein